ncbi:MAG TPA: hypothetical protein VMS41_10810, partial [Gaiellaceae bacterium]|nr:hypothetical protein [Gaiellaceae bacterium]
MRTPATSRRTRSRRGGNGGSGTTITATRRVRCIFPAIVQIKALPKGGAVGAGFRVLRGATRDELMRGQ